MPGSDESSSATCGADSPLATPQSQLPALRQPQSPPFSSRLPSGFDLVACISNAAILVERVILRQVQADLERAQQPAQETALAVPGEGEGDDDDSVLVAMEGLVSSFKTGRAPAGLKDAIVRFISNQGEKAELVNNMLMTHDMDRLPRFLRVRHRIETYLCKAAHRGDLSPPEALAFLKVSQEAIEDITARVRSGATNVKDVEGLVDKTDFVRQLGEVELSKKFADASPQVREILRKVGYKLGKLAGAYD